MHKYHHINNFLSFSPSQCLRLVNRVVLSHFRTGTPFSSLAKELPIQILNGILPC